MATVVLEKDVTGHDDWVEVEGTQFDDTTNDPKTAYEKAHSLLHIDPAIYRIVQAAHIEAMAET